MKAIEIIINTTVLPLAFTILLVGCASANTDTCKIEVNGEEYEFAHIYTVRAPDAYVLDDDARLTRVHCTQDPISDSELADEGSLSAALQGEGAHPQAVLAYIQDSGSVVTVAMKWEGEVFFWPGSFGGMSELHFEGSNGPDRISGTLTTETPLEESDPDEVSLRVSAVLDRAINATW